MPTGFTAKMYDGKEETFEQFVLSCARGMGICIMQRDDGPGLPTKTKIADYYETNYGSASNKMADWKNNPQKRKAEYDQYVKETEAANKKSQVNAATLSARYYARLAEVHAWTAPEGLEGMKKFMVNQIEDSIQFDCTPYTTEVLGFDEWVEERERDIKWKLDYATRSLAENVERVKTQNEYIDALYKSLGLDYDKVMKKGL
jgi:hypothetical protein